MATFRQFCKHIHNLMSGLWDFIDTRKIVRRIALLWAIWLITVVALKASEVLTEITAAGATVVTAVIGILTVVIGLYQSHRHDDDKQV